MILFWIRHCSYRYIYLGKIHLIDIGIATCWHVVPIQVVNVYRVNNETMQLVNYLRST